MTTLNWQTKLQMRGRGGLLIFVGFAFNLMLFSNPSASSDVIGSIPHSSEANTSHGLQLVVQRRQSDQGSAQCIAIAATAAACTSIFLKGRVLQISKKLRLLRLSFVNGEAQAAGIKHVLEPGMLFVTEATNNRILYTSYIL